MTVTTYLEALDRWVADAMKDGPETLIELPAEWVAELLTVTHAAVTVANFFAGKVALGTEVLDPLTDAVNTVLARTEAA